MGVLCAAESPLPTFSRNDILPFDIIIIPPPLWSLHKRQLFFSQCSHQEPDTHCPFQQKLKKFPLGICPASWRFLRVLIPKVSEVYSFMLASIDIIVRKYLEGTDQKQMTKLRNLPPK